MYNLFAFLFRRPCRKCEECGVIGLKQNMQHRYWDVWFCSDSCSQENYEASIW